MASAFETWARKPETKSLLDTAKKMRGNNSQTSSQMRTKLNSKSKQPLMKSTE